MRHFNFVKNLTLRSLISQIQAQGRIIGILEYCLKIIKLSINPIFRVHFFVFRWFMIKLSSLLQLAGGG